MALDKFVHRLKNDEDITRQKLLRQEVLPDEPLRQRRRKRYLVADKHLFALSQRYVAHYRANGDILRYLRCVQHHLHKPRFPGEAANVAEDPLEEVADDEDGGDGGVEEGGSQDNARILRRESHPGRGLHGFEDEEQDRVGGQAKGNAARARGAGMRQANVVDEALPGFSQAGAAARSQTLSHVPWGPPQLPSQSSSAASTSAFIRRPSEAAAARRGTAHLAAFNALTGYGDR